MIPSTRCGIGADIRAKVTSIYRGHKRVNVHTKVTVQVRIQLDWLG
jgi:hypothetical protein